jgi:hypothetical protein
VVPFLLRNTQQQPISLAAARGDCFCFKGATIRTPTGQIKAGAVGRVILRFSREEVGAGRVIRQVLLSFVGGPRRPMLVVLKLNVMVARPKAQLLWYPQSICLGVIRRLGALKPQHFSILTPRGVALRVPTISPPDMVRVAQISSPGDKPETDSFGRTAHEFVVHFLHLPGGAISEKVTIGTTDKYVPKIVIPITGQVEK